MSGYAPDTVANYRNQVKKLLEWQRHTHSKRAAGEDAAVEAEDAVGKPVVNVEEALRTSFNVLLERTDRDHLPGSTIESDAFQIVAIAVQLEAFQLSEDIQADMAELVYHLWTSTSPGIVCRVLLETMLARKSQDSAVFVQHMLRILQQTFTVGNKRSLQILVHLFDVVDEHKLEETFPDLIDKLAQCISSQSGAQPAARILSKLAIRKAEGDPTLLLDFLKPFIAQDAQRAKQVVHENLLPPILSQVPQLRQLLLDWLRKEAATSSNHLYAFLSLARLSQSAEESSSETSDAFDDLISTSLYHEEPLIRFEAFRLLSSLPAGNAPSRRFALHHLPLHTSFWKYNLSDSDSPAVRTGLIGEWKHFILRARTSSNAAQRVIIKYQKLPESQQVPHEAKEAQEYIDAIRSFFQDWVEYAVTQLLPVKPYRCHISSLIFLQILLEQGIDPQSHIATQQKGGKAKEVITWPFEVQVTTPELTEQLIACIRSTYDDVRNTAYAILARVPLTSQHLQLIQGLGFMLVQRKREADIASATLYLRLVSVSTSSDLVAGSVLSRLLDMLEGRLQAFKESFGDAADSSPIHGILQSIAHLLESSLSRPSDDKEEIDSISRRCVTAVYDVWEVTKPILCRGDIDLLEDGDDMGAEDSADQVVLNASWRSIKEASNLLSVVLALPLALSRPLWTIEELTSHASLFATWLLEITHRGVFAHVSNAYSRLCTCLVRTKGSVSELPASWLKKHLSDILDVERPAARRSAGLPHLLLGVVSCFPPQSEALKHAFGRLVECASPSSQASNTIRTHAIHCFRVLLQDGKLAGATKPYIQAAFSIAVSGFGHSHWGVRNASLLLYAALIQRLFSNKKENHLPLARRTSIVDFFNQYEGLVPSLVEALAAGIGKTEPEALGSVFSVLLLLSLLTMPASSPKAEELASSFYPLVDACASSAVWKVRETAAAAMTGLVPETDVYAHCDTLLSSCDKATSSNQLHGRLMQVRALLSSQTGGASSIVTPETQEAWDVILCSLDRITHRDQPLPVLTQTLDILAMSPVPLPDALAAKLHSLACRHYGQRRPGNETYNSALARILLKTEPERYLEKCLTSPYPSVQAEALAYFSERPQTSFEGHLCRKDLLFQVATAPASGIANRVAAVEALAPQDDAGFNRQDLDTLVELYKSSGIPNIRLSLLPILAKLVDRVTAGKALVSLVRREIARLASDESSGAREAACLAMSFTGSWKQEQPFAYSYQLLHFLQDDDIDVRALAGRIASATLAHGQSICTSRAIEVTWRHCKKSATADDIRRLVEELEARLQQITEAVEAGSQLLFAVERANMHIDITIDVQHIRELFALHNQIEKLHDSKMWQEIQRCQERLNKVIDDIRSETEACNSNELENAYSFRHASLLVRTLAGNEI